MKSMIHYVGYVSWWAPSFPEEGIAILRFSKRLKCPKSDREVVGFVVKV